MSCFLKKLHWFWKKLWVVCQYVIQCPYFVILSKIPYIYSTRNFAEMKFKLSSGCHFIFLPRKLKFKMNFAFSCWDNWATKFFDSLYRLGSCGFGGNVWKKLPPATFQISQISSKRSLHAQKRLQPYFLWTHNTNRLSVMRWRRLVDRNQVSQSDGRTIGDDPLGIPCSQNRL